MSSIFLRIYGGLLFTLVLVAVLSGLALTIINGVRLQDFRENTSRGTFRIIARELEQIDTERQSAWLQRWERQLGIPLEIVAESDSELSERSRESLRDNDVIITPQSDNDFVVYTRLNDDQLIQGKVSNLTDQLAIGTITLVRSWLLGFPFEQRAGELAVIVPELFSYPVQLYERPEAFLTEQTLQQLKLGHVINFYNHADKTLTLYAGMPDSGRYLKLGPLSLLDLYPFRLLATIGLFVLASISIAIYVLVRGLERRLRKMERAAVRIARGDLDVRVKVHGADSVGQLAMAFNNMASHIQRLLSIQKEMIRGVSHELRTPVARLRFGLAMVADAEERDERERQVDAMDRDIEELDNLVDEILTYAKLEEGTPTINFQRLDPEVLVTRVVTDNRRQQDKVAIEHIACRTVEMRRQVDAEERYLHRAIQNLVGNACRYADSKVQVKVTYGHDSCRVDVEDDGPGIPESERERIFTAFARLDNSRTRASGGYGLGLSIVRRIMHWHNGRAMVGHSDQLGGARFSLVWPRRQRGRT